MSFSNLALSHSSTAYDPLKRNIPMKTVNFDSRFITLPTTLKQPFLPDPVIPQKVAFHVIGTIFYKILN